MASLPRELTTREDDRHGSELGDIIRQLASDNPGVAFAAMRAMARKLEKYKCSFLDLADHIENGGGLSDADKQKISAAIESARIEGYAEGVRAAEKQSRFNNASEFQSTDGSDQWKVVALYVQKERHRLPAQHHEFVNDMAARTAWDREPTLKQHRYLHSLFLRLGGRIT